MSLRCEKYLFFHITLRSIEEFPLQSEFIKIKIANTVLCVKTSRRLPIKDDSAVGSRR